MLRKNCKCLTIFLLLFVFMSVLQGTALSSPASIDIQYSRSFYIPISNDGKPNYDDMYSGDAYIYLEGSRDCFEYYAGVKGTLVVVSADDENMGRKSLIDYVYITDISRRGLDEGDVLKWYFPSNTELNGSFVYPASKDLEAKTTPSYMPYVELVSSDNTITAIKWRFVSADMSSSDLAALGAEDSISPSVTEVDINAAYQILSGDRFVWEYNTIDEELSGDAEFGIMEETISVPVSHDVRVSIRTKEDDLRYYWSFYFDGVSSITITYDYDASIQSSDFTAKLIRRENAYIDSNGEPEYQIYTNNNMLTLSFTGKLSFDSDFDSDSYYSYYDIDPRLEITISDDESTDSFSIEAGYGRYYNGMEITLSDTYAIDYLADKTITWQVTAIDTNTYQRVVLDSGTFETPASSDIMTKEDMLRTNYFPYVKLNKTVVNVNDITWGLVKAISEDWEHEYIYDDDGNILYEIPSYHIGDYPVSYDDSAAVAPSSVSVKDLVLTYLTSEYHTDNDYYIYATKAYSDDFGASSTSFKTITINQPYALLRDAGDITVEFTDSNDITYIWTFDLAYSSYSDATVPSNITENLKPYYYVSTSARLINGKPDYNYSNHYYSSTGVTLVGKEYVSGDESIYGSLFGTIVLSHDTYSYKSGSLLRYSRDDENVRYTSYLSLSDATSKDTIFWEFPASSDLNGKSPVPDIRTTAKQLETFVPYVELQHEGVNVTGIKWCFVNSSDETATPVYPEGVTSMLLTVRYEGSSFDATSADTYRTLEKTFSADFEPTASSYTPPTIEFKRWPELAISGVTFQFEAGNVTYTWTFNRVDGDSDYSTEAISDWDGLDSYPPIKLAVGDTKDVTITFSDRSNEYSKWGNAYVTVHDSSIITADVSLIAGTTLSRSIQSDYDYETGEPIYTTISHDTTTGMKVTFKGLKPGRTSITAVLSTIYEGNNEYYVGSYSTSLPREVWVLNADGTDPADPSEISNENDPDYNPWYKAYVAPDPEVIDNGGGSGGGSGSGTVIEYNENLSVNPEASAKPSTASSAAVSSFSEFVSKLSSDEKVYTNGTWGTTKTAAQTQAVFNEISGDLIAHEPPQLLADVLPTFTASEDGFYVFDVTLNSQIAKDTPIFWYSDYAKAKVTAADEEYPDFDENNPEDYYVFMDSTGAKIDVAPENHEVTVAAYMTKGTHNPIITAEANNNDVKIIEDQTEVPDAIRTGPGESSGGCDAGFSALGLAIVAGLLQLKRKSS